MDQRRRFRPLAYVVVVAAVAAALALRALPPLAGLSAPLLFAVTAGSAWYGGLGPGLLAAMLSGLGLAAFGPLQPFSAAYSFAGVVRLAALGVLATVSHCCREDRRRLDAARQESQHKDEFLALFAHESRNCLAAMLHNLRVVESHELGEPMESARLATERQTRHLARLVNDLLDLSRIRLGKLALFRQRVDLCETVERAVAMVRPRIEAGEQVLDVALPSSPLLLDADATRLEQIVVNLLSNAAQYTGRGGDIGLTAEGRGDEAVLTVRDSGIGLAPEQVAHVFELFHQGPEGSPDGLGIGLSLVRALAEAHGGRVEASSEGPGKGSSFRVYLPLLEGDAPPSPRSPRGAPNLAGLNGLMLQQPGVPESVGMENGENHDRE